MPLINYEITLDLNWSGKRVIASTIEMKTYVMIDGQLS